MQVIQKNLIITEASLSSNPLLNKALQGKWCHWRRYYVVNQNMSDNKENQLHALASLNFFERAINLMSNRFRKLFGKDVRVLSKNELSILLKIKCVANQTFDVKKISQKDAVIKTTADNTTQIRVTVDMIKSFIDVNELCQTACPCQHGPIEVELKNGRKVSAHISSPDIYSILKELKDIGIEHKDWNHFSIYESGWPIRPANEILTEIFKKPI